MIFNDDSLQDIRFNGDVDKVITNGLTIVPPYLRGFVGDGSAYILLSSAIALAGDFEIRVVIKPTKAVGATDCIIFGNAANTMFFRIASNNKAQFNFGTYYEVTLTESFENNVSANLIVKRIGENLYIYKNGALVGTKFIGGTSRDLDMLIFKGGAPNVYWGVMTDFRVYDSTGTLTHQYLLNETEGTTAADNIGVIDGTVINPYVGVWAKTDIRESFVINPTITKLLLASDMHLDFWDEVEGEGGLTSAQRFDLFVEKANEEVPHIVVILADTNVNDITLPQGNDRMPATKAKLDNLTMPYKWVHGSHEFYNDEQWMSLLGYPKNYSFTVRDYAFIVIDTYGDYETINPNSGYGYKEVDQTWLAAELNKYTDKQGIFILAHYVNSSIDTLTRTLLLTHSNFKGIFFGHVHNETVWTIDDKPWIMCGHWSVVEGGSWDNDKPWSFRILELDDLGNAKTYIIRPAHEYPTSSQARTVVDVRAII